MDSLNLNANKVLPRSFRDTDIGVTAFNSTAVVGAAYRQISEEIEQLEVAIRAWKERHNTLSFIARLPSEVLSTIFGHVAAAVYHSTFHSNLDWITVTHVCTYWRRTALDCPSLWTTIPFSKFRWAMEMLKRSKTAPLTILANINGRDYRHMDLVQSVIANISRIQKLSLIQNHHSFRNDDSLEKILTQLVKPAPLLEKFSVVFMHRTSDHITMLPEGIFSGEVPRLQEVELRNCALAWDGPLLCALTTLKISFVPLSARPSMDQLIAALSRMPDLETLELCDILPVQTSLSAAASETGSELIVSLPHLTRLHIESDAPEAAFLLNHLVYPPTISITLICTLWCNSSNTTDASYDLRPVRTFCDILSKSQPVRCLMTRHVPYPKTIQLSTYHVPGTFLLPPSDPKVNLVLKRGERGSGVTLRKSWTDMVQSLWTSVPMKDLESLHVIETGLWHSITAEITPHGWSHIFTTLAAAKLKMLRVASCSGLYFLQALSSPDASESLPETGRTKRHKPLKLPTLRKLAIEGWVFDDSSGRRTCAEWLKAYLERRRKRRAPINALSLTQCHHITDDDVWMLQEVVKKVTWDGLENFSDDEEFSTEDDEDEDDYM
jgi:F-box-like